MASVKTVQLVLAERPENGTLPDPHKTWKKVETQTKELETDEVLVRVIYLSLDPAMRGWLMDRKSYIPPVKIGDPMRAGGIGEVIESKNNQFKKGDIVNGMLNWQSFVVINGKHLNKLNTQIPLEAWLSILGMTGLTAYFGLLNVGQPKEGDTVLVSGAAGATGSAVGQIAKIKGLRVVGIAGSDEKCKWLKELGFDEAINYKNGNLTSAIAAACPNGVNIFFDNVGGETLDAALANLAQRARVVICGGISQYNQKETVGPKNYLNILRTSSRMEGFIVFNYLSEYPTAIAELSNWLLQGKLKYKVDIRQGLDSAPAALLSLFDGSNQGKLVVQVSEDHLKHKAKL